jgi:hypothetical protein
MRQLHQKRRLCVYLITERSLESEDSYEIIQSNISDTNELFKAAGDQSHRADVLLRRLLSRAGQRLGDDLRGLAQDGVCNRRVDSVAFDNAGSLGDRNFDGLAQHFVDVRFHEDIAQRAIAQENATPTTHRRSG